jgi:hypothetical protein
MILRLLCIWLVFYSLLKSQNYEAPDDGRKSARNMYSGIRIQQSFNDFKYNRPTVTRKRQ